MKKKKAKLNIKKKRNWIIFNNGVKVILPIGWRFGEEFEIRGIEKV
jgi:hypothetical protein